MDPLSRGREVAGGVLRSSPKPEKKQQFFAIGEGSRFFVACFVHGSSQMCLYKTPGRRPPFITGRFVNAVTRGGSEPLTSAPRSDFMAQSLLLSSMSVQDSESRRFELLEPTRSIFRRFVLIASGTEVLRRVSSMKFKVFLTTSLFHCHRSFTDYWYMVDRGYFYLRPGVYITKNISQAEDFRDSH